MLFVMMYRSLRRTDHSSRAVLPSVVFLSDREASINSRPLPTRGRCVLGKKLCLFTIRDTKIYKIIIIIIIIIIIDSCFYL